MRKYLCLTLFMIGSAIGLYKAYRYCVSLGKAEALECLLHKKGRFFSSLDPCLWDDEESN